MAYLIDGNNLLGRIAPHELREKGGRDGLVVRLLAFQRVTRARIHLVFDGNPEQTPTDVPVNPKFTIHYPGEGGSADDVIRDMILAADRQAPLLRRQLGPGHPRAGQEEGDRGR